MTDYLIPMAIWVGVGAAVVAAYMWFASRDRQ